MLAEGILHADSLWTPVLIFCARVVDVSLGTIRMISVTRGHRLTAVVLGFFELLIWVFAVSRVLTQLDRIENIVAFAGGFSAGNAVGMSIEARLALGVQTLSFISRGMANAVAERLRYAGLRVTTFVGSGRDGPVSLCMTVVPRRQTQEAIRMAREIDPEVVITVEDVRQTTAIHTASYGAGKVPLALPQILLLRSRKSSPKDA
jgi:uncharacterized protein YebE (UPF0316 family)